MDFKQGWRKLMKHGILPLQAHLENYFAWRQAELARSVPPEFLHAPVGQPPSPSATPQNKPAPPLHRAHSFDFTTDTLAPLSGVGDAPAPQNMSLNCLNVDQVSHLYTIAFLLAEQPDQCALLYRQVAAVLTRYVERVILDSLRRNEDTLLLASFAARWETFVELNRQVGIMFSYLNRYYVPNTKLQTTTALGTSLFERLVVSPLWPLLMRELCHCIGRVHSHSEPQLLALIRETVQVMEDLRIYSRLEVALVPEFSNYYCTVARSLPQRELTIFGFAEKTQALRTREERLVGRLLPVSSHAMLMGLFYERGIRPALHEIITDKTRLWTMFFSSRENSHFIELLFETYESDADSLRMIAGIFEQSLVENGNIIMSTRITWNDEKEEEDYVPPDYDPHHMVRLDQIQSQFGYVEALIHLYDLFHHFAVNCFRNHPLFDDALKSGMTRLLHKDVGVCTNTELIARFCDYVLNDSHELLSSKRRADQAVEASLDSLAALYSYSPDHDLFTYVYRQYLATRLLENRSHSEEAERSMIAKMKLRTGPRFTSRLEHMVNDAVISLHINVDFQRYLVSRSRAPRTPARQGGIPRVHSFSQLGGGRGSISLSDVDEKFGGLVIDESLAVPFEVKLLSKGIWPISRTISVRPPDEFQTSALLFERYFTNRFDEKKSLSWAWDLGLVTLEMVQVDTSRLVCTVIATTLQAFVLSLFNDSPVWSLDEVCAELHLKQWTGQRVLHSLLFGKFQLLARHGLVMAESPSGSSTGSPYVAPYDRFVLNPRFVPTKKIIALPSPELHERRQPVARSFDPTVTIKAYIVRLMKREKTMRLTDIIEHVMADCQRFRPELRMISAVLDSLVRTEYLQRSVADHDLFHYVP